MVGSRFGGRPLALPSHLTAATDGDASDQDGAQSPGGFSDTFSPHPALGMAHKPHVRGSGGAGVGHHSRLSVTDASNAEFPFTAPTTVRSYATQGGPLSAPPRAHRSAVVLSC